MYLKVYLSLALFVAMPSWSQVPISDPAAVPGIGGKMLTPPPVSGQAYPTEVGSEVRSNYLRAGFTFTPSYSNDVVGEANVPPVSDFGYSFFPTLTVDKTTSREHLTLTYSPSFTIYQRTSSENQTNQNLSLSFQYRLSPHVTVSLRDNLQKISNVFNQPGLLSGGAVSGLPQPPLNAVIGPVADQLGNTADAEMTYQFSRNGMIGASGRFTNLDFLNPSQVPGLYDSHSSGGSAFYSHRLLRNSYIGGVYQYSTITAYPPNLISEVQTHTVFLFCTIYFTRAFSLSLSVGPQHFDAAQSPMPTYGSWSPTLSASTGWQGRHTSFAASYLRSVTGGGGLVGVFQSNTAAAFARWKLARAWSTTAAANYSINKDETPTSFISSGGGHGVGGSVSAQHQLSDRFKVEFGYSLLHQSYNGIPVISNSPNINREYVSFSYSFARALGE
jgi:hypothetical protein